MKNPIVRFALAVSFLLSSAMHGSAQGSTSSLLGSVLDAQGLPIPDASLALQAANGTQRSASARRDGSYELAGVQAGEYRLTVSSPRFQSKEVRLRVEVNQRQRLDVVLETSGLSESIDVVDATPLLHAADASIGEVIDQRQVAELPLNGRQFLELAQLVPNVHISHGAQSGSTSALYWRPGQNSAVSIAGGRPNSNSYLLDGTVNTDPSFNTYVISLPPDSIREFQIQTGTYSAALGGAGTGQVNVVTKSGTDELHGSFYEYLRNDAFDARPFNNMDELPPFSQNQFGATLGGPIRKGRTHFFVGYEGFRSTQGQSMIMSVPLPEWRKGDFSSLDTLVYDPASSRPNPDFDPSQPESSANPKVIRDPFPGNRIPEDRIDPVARAVLEMVPPPNMSGSNNNYLDTRAQELSNDQINVRIDHSFRTGAAVFARYSLSNEAGFTPENLPGFGANHDNRVQNLTLTAINPLRSSMVNELRLGVQKMDTHRLGEKANGTDWVSVLGIPGVGFGGAEAYGLPRFVVQGFEPFGDSLLCTPCKYDNTVLHLGDRLTFPLGNHSLKVGGDIRYFRWNMRGFFQNRGFFTFTSGFTTRTATSDGTGSGLASFLLGLPVIAQRQAGIPSMNMRQSTYDFFVQDDWRVSRHLTVNLGLRYELNTPLHDINKVLTNLDFIDGRPMAYIGGQNGYPKGLAFADKNNWAPRLGLALSPSDGRNVLRGGAGIYYSYSDMNLWCNQVHNVPLVFPEIQQSNNFIPSISGFGFGPPDLGKTLVSFTALDPRAKTPIIYQASASLERRLGQNMMVQVGYMGAWGRNLDRARLVNNAPPGPGPLGPRRPYKTISFVPGTMLPPAFEGAPLTFPVGPINLLENTARSSYNSAWILAKRSFSNGLSFLASYTYSRSFTDAPAFRSPAMESEVPQDSFNLDAEWGPGGCDVPHRFVASVLYKLPMGGEGRRSFFGRLISNWQVAGIFQAQSGFPFTISVFGDTANAGSLLNVNPVRADLVPGVDPNLPKGERSADKWFDTDAFSTPAAFTFGNVGRNSMRGPGMYKLDVALEKQILLGGAREMQFRVECFNCTNHTNLGTPERFVNTPQFGTITMAATSARQIQFALRMQF